MDASEGERITMPWNGLDPARRRAPAAVAALATATLVLAGCGWPGTPAPDASAPPSALALQQQYVQVVRRVSPSVVLIRTDTGLGSGIVYNSTGDIVTNDHVVDGSTDFEVVLADGVQYPARVVGTFRGDDLAVLHVDATGLQPATFADSDRLAVGDITLAIGNPLGLQSSVTDGIVSALGRTVNEPDGIALPGVIQTSAAINPGNSGGALVNLRGDVVGIPTLAATDPQPGGEAPGIGFAIPGNTVRDIADQLIRDGKVTNSHRAHLGVEVAATTGGGLLVVQVQPGGPAARAGIRAGDLLAAVNGTATPDQATLADLVASLRPGQVARVTVVHTNGTRQTVSVTLGQYPG
jgi:putative serine protease PepD